MNPKLPMARLIPSANYLAKSTHQEAVAEAEQPAEMAGRLPLFLRRMNFPD